MKKYLALSMILISVLILASGCAKTEEVATGNVEAHQSGKKQDTSITKDIEYDDYLDNNEQETAEEAEISVGVRPLSSTIDDIDLRYADLAVELDYSSINGSTIVAEVYEYERFKLDEINNLKVGDTLFIDGLEVEVTSVEHDSLDAFVINGGLDVGGYYLVASGGDTVYPVGYSDVKTYNKIGELTLEMHDDFLFVDASDLDNEALMYNIDDLDDADYTGTPHNLTLTVIDGKAASLSKSYTP